MLEFFARLRFWQTWQRLPFLYNPETGVGVAVQSYNFMSDKIVLRYSRFGYVLHTKSELRKRYVAIVREHGVVPQ